jgi:hypothetical protein
MNAWVVVKDLPYFATSNSDGQLEIKNLPAGKWTFQAWHGYGGGGYITEASRGSKSEKWKKGKFEIEVKPGENDLGTITIPAKAFKK